MIAALGFPYQGYTVRRAGGILRYLPTKANLSKAIQFLPDDQFVDQMKEYNRRYHVGTEVRTELRDYYFFLVFSSLSCDQNMTRNDYEQHGFEY